MRIIFMDENKERMNENFEYFNSVDGMIFLAAQNMEHLCAMAAYADIAVIYTGDEAERHFLPPVGLKTYFVCHRETVAVKLKCYCANAECIEGMPTAAQLHKHLKRVSPAYKKKISNVHARIDRVMELCGIAANLKGHDYIKTALHFCNRDRKLVHSVTKLLYPELAKHFKTGAANIERNIRHAVESSWHSEHEFYSSLFCNIRDKRPTNTVFLRTLLNYVNSAAAEDEI